MSQSNNSRSIVAEKAGFVRKLNHGDPRVDLIKPTKTSRAANYKTLDLISHVRLRPETYTGSPQPEDKTLPHYDFETGRIDMRGAHISDAELRIFIEPLSNAIDNALLNPGVPNFIDVTVDEDSVTIRNGGNPVPVEPSEEDPNIWIPQKIFATMLSGSNFDDMKERKGGGRNGLGVKLTSILSTKLVARGVDNQTGEYWKVTTEDGLKKFSFHHEEIVRGKLIDGVQLDPTIPWTEVKYWPDFAFFKRDELFHADQHYSIYAALCLGTSLCTKFEVTFNGISFNCQTISDFADICFPDATNKIPIYLWPEGVKVKKNKDGTQVSLDGQLPILEAMVIDTPDENKTFSFVNGVNTFKGGVHIEAILKPFSDMVISQLKEIKAEDGKRFPITLKETRKNISIVANCYIDKPTFNGQLKEELKTPDIKLTLDDSILPKMKKWNIYKVLMDTISFKKRLNAGKEDRKRKRDTGKAVGADKAGTKESNKCTLYIVEGDSAKAYILTMLQYIADGNKYNGVLPFRGKPISTMKASVERILENEEYKTLKANLGLIEGVDYSLPENFNKLRYGSVCIVADADHDGKHITGLILCMFYTCFPELLKMGYIYQMNTPVIRVGVKNKFYTEEEFKEWLDSGAKVNKNDIEYLKGLGSSEDNYIKDDISDPKYTQFVFDEQAEEYFKLAFDTAQADDRKDWLSSYQPKFVDVIAPLKSISGYINDEMIQYSIYSLERAIPSMISGMKRTQIKIIYTAMKYFRSHNDYPKVDVISARTSTETHYHHGENSITNTSIKMTQWHVGANNMPYFIPKGMFGTRLDLGNDAAAGRYIHMKIQPWVKYVFREEFEPILNYRIDEGALCEPETYYPLIPMCLANGGDGMATGWSTYIPQFNPEDLIGWLLNKIDGKPLTEPKPWYRGFTGDIEVVETTRKSKVDDEFEDSKVKIKKFRSYGKFEIVSPTHVRVTEIPVGRSILDYYHKFLMKVVNGEAPETPEQLRAKGIDPDTVVKPLYFNKVEKNLKTNSCTFDLKGVIGTPTFANLRLIKSKSMSNMVLLDNLGRPVRFDTVTQILEVFYSNILDAYHRRYKYNLERIQDEIQKNKEKSRFIKLVCDDVIRIGVKSSEMNNLLTAHNIRKDVTKMPNSKLSPEGLEAMNKKIDLLHQEYEKAKLVTPKEMYKQELLELKKVYKNFDFKTE